MTSTKDAMVTSTTTTATNWNTYRPPADYTLSERDLSDLELLLSGALAPLAGYLNKAQYDSVLEKMRLPTGEVWPLPIVLPVPKSAMTLRECKENEGESGTKDLVKLRDCLGTILAELECESVYEPDITYEMEKVLGSTDGNHPYASVLKSFSNSVYLGGKVTAVHNISHFDFTEYRTTPAEVREYIKQNKWEAVVGFQTRNPMHKSHYELTIQAMKEVRESTGKQVRLLLSPVVGPTQPGDVDYRIRVRCYKKIVDEYKAGEVKLVLLPVAMRMAGPREAVWHAIIRRNYGCTHFIVGRDHAGPTARKSDGKPFYGVYEAHELLKSVESDLGIKPVFGRNLVYVGEESGGYVMEDQIPEGATCQTISGTAFRSLLEAREPVPAWYSFPSVSAELQKHYKPQNERGFCVYFTGLPCAGKSSLAIALEALLLENDSEMRKITVLDADIIRTHLSRGLGFSKEDRSLNVRRVGYVASEVVKHNGICIVANIAPYQEDRDFNRQLISSAGGGYIEVYVSTPLEVCESRDVKELYKKARLGVIKQFTGVSDPYEPPTNAEFVVDSSTEINKKVAEISRYLQQGKWTTVSS
eukprot:Lankesteria_metandrocarpae@DN3667_c0_g1_i1.p1